MKNNFATAKNAPVTNDATTSVEQATTATIEQLSRFGFTRIVTVTHGQTAALSIRKIGETEGGSLLLIVRPDHEEEDTAELVAQIIKSDAKPQVVTVQYKNGEIQSGVTTLLFPNMEGHTLHVLA